VNEEEVEDAFSLIGGEGAAGEDGLGFPESRAFGDIFQAFGLAVCSGNEIGHTIIEH
jgi:hypothetical protein